MKKILRTPAVLVCTVVALILVCCHVAAQGDTAKDNSLNVLLKPGNGQYYYMTEGEEQEISVIYGQDMSVLTWKSHHPECVSIEGSGDTARLTALMPGTAILEVTDGRLHCNMIVEVSAPETDGDDPKGSF